MADTGRESGHPQRPETEDFYERLFEQSVDGILLIRGGAILRANPAFCTMHGYEQSELIGFDPIELVHPDDRSHARARLAALGGGRPISDAFVYRTLHRDGHTLWIEATSRRLAGTDRLILQTICRDVTERELAHRKLRESEARYRSLFSGVPIGLYRTTPEGRIVDVNPALVEMLGYPDRETLLATPVSEGYVDRTDREAWKQRIERHGWIAESEAVWRKHDGTPVWIEESARAVRDGKGRVLHYEGSAKDISDRKRAEAGLERETAYFEQLFAGAPEAVVLCDGDGIVQRVNREFSRLFGYSEEDSLGRDIDSLVAPESVDLRDEAERITGRVTAGERVTLQSVRRRADGSLIDVDVLAQPIYVGGRQVGNYSIYRDIGPRVAAEEALSREEARFEDL